MVCARAAGEVGTLRDPDPSTGMDGVQLLLLQHLSADAGRLGEPGNAPGAARYMLARSFAEAAGALDRAGADEAAVREALIRHRRVADQLPRGHDPGVFL